LMALMTGLLVGLNGEFNIILILAENSLVKTRLFFLVC
jgi:hypothetical protein